MTALDLLVRDGLVVTPKGTFRASIGIEDGVIVAIGSSASMPMAERTIDASGLLVFPGIIDEHVHFRDPGLEWKEDFRTGSMAAAAGGVTTVLDMPNTDPPTVDADGFRAKLEAASRKSLVDFGFYAGVVPGRVEELRELAELGVVGVKVYMSETTGIREPVDDLDLIRTMRVASSLGLRVGVHAEDGRTISRLREELRATGQRNPLLHMRARPVEAEVLAVGRALLAARLTGCGLHVFHLSSAAALEVIRALRPLGVDVTVETCPHYLLLDGEDSLSKLGNVAKVNPPIRGRADAEALWDAIARGEVDAIGSDHAPHLPQEKMVDDVWSAPSGFPGVETMLPLMLTEVHKGRLSYEKIAALLSENPARIWGLYPRKGSIMIGSDGDLTLVDPDAEWVIRADRLHSKSKVTPFEGLRVRGKPVYTVVRGEVVMERGEVVEDARRGQLVRPVRRGER
ncbi:MAG: allantoinase AllB [Nitrososphaerota archaeon]